MIVKRNFNPVKVISYFIPEMLTAVLVSNLVFVLSQYYAFNISIPFSISAILGSALAIFIAFRNNSSYSRWWEARTNWSGIVNAGRVFARLIITFTDSHAHQTNFDEKRSEQFKKEMINLMIAWIHTLRFELRSQPNWHELRPYFDEESYYSFLSSTNKVNTLLLLVGQKIYKAMANGTLGGFDSFQLEGQLLSLSNHYSNCERIKHTPLLRQYDYFTRLFLYTFILLLPFSLIGDLNKLNLAHLTIPIVTIIAFVFSILAKVGEVNENPFENKITDIPMTALCIQIERDLKEMIGDKAIPEMIIPENGYLF